MQSSFKITVLMVFFTLIDNIFLACVKKSYVGDFFIYFFECDGGKNLKHAILMTFMAAV